MGLLRYGRVMLQRRDWRRGWIAVAAVALLWPGGLVQAAGCEEADVRWAGTSNRLYVSGADTVCTIPELDALVPAARIEPAEEGVWFVGANIVLTDGARLNIHGPAVEELRLKSNNVAGGVVYVRADWGTIDVRDTRITSWNETAGGPDTEYAAYQRAHIQARSRMGGDGTPLESTMNIINSDVGYLGFAGAEAYGLSWKVNGHEPDLYDLVGVFGEVRGSRIHHNYFGMYTFGAEAMTWAGNEIDHNVLYGLDPHDDSDRLIIEDNDVHDNGSHGIICSQRCDHLVIRRNRSYDNGGNGIMLHRSTNDSVVEENEVYDNADSGLALFESHRNTLRRNRADGNGKGIRLSVGSADNVIEDNSFFDSAKYGIYTYQGSDVPTEGDGRPKGNRFENNVIRGSGVNGLKLKQADENVFIGNDFTDNGKELRFDDAQRNRFEGNIVSGNDAYGLLLDRGSVGNELADNMVADNGKAGMYVKGGSDEVRIERNTIRDHDQAPVLLRQAKDGWLKGNIFGGPGSMYVYAAREATAVIELAGEAAVSVRAGDAASQLTVMDPASRVLRNNRGVATTAQPDRSELIVTRALSNGVVTVTPDVLTAVPDSGTVAINRTAAGWTATASAGGIAVDYTLGGLTPGAVYDVVKGGTVIFDDLTADGGGAVSFSDTLADTSETAFEVR